MQITIATKKAAMDKSYCYHEFVDGKINKILEVFRI
jgi:hypothetical protein